MAGVDGFFFQFSFHEILLGIKVIEVREHHGGVHFALHGVQGEVGLHGEPLGPHLTMGMT